MSGALQATPQAGVASAWPGPSPLHQLPHALHASGAIWPEKNCYTDLWIGVLHGLALDPLAVMGASALVDFEGDQWTFFKPSHDLLRERHGLDVQELTIWRPLLDHALEHLAAGKLLSVEADAFWLPDVAGTDYRQNHTKTTIVLVSVDAAAKRLVYFHNAGCFELTGEDFDGTFGLTPRPADAVALPLFAEFIRLDRTLQRPAAELHALARTELPGLLARRPVHNPVQRFAERFLQELPALREQGLPHYHAWAFAGTRQMGSAFELTARWIAWWSGDQRDEELSRAIAAFEQLSAQAMTFILKGARMVNSSRPAEPGALFSDMASAWDEGWGALAAWQQRQ